MGSFIALVHEPNTAMQPTGPRIPYRRVSRPCTHPCPDELDSDRCQDRPGGRFKVAFVSCFQGDAASPSGAGVQCHWPRKDIQQHVDNAPEEKSPRRITYEYGH